MSRTQDKTYWSKHSSRSNWDNKPTPQSATCYAIGQTNQGLKSL
ncbi:hypothetical protein QUA83_11620 [Microcoleus sp. K1-B1]